MVSAFVLHTPQVFSLPLSAQKHYANELVDICFQRLIFSRCLGLCVCVCVCVCVTHIGGCVFTYSRSHLLKKTERYTKVFQTARMCSSSVENDAFVLIYFTIPS